MPVCAAAVFVPEAWVFCSSLIFVLNLAISCLLPVCEHEYKHGCRHVGMYLTPLESSYQDSSNASSLQTFALMNACMHLHVYGHVYRHGSLPADMLLPVGAAVTLVFCNLLSSLCNLAISLALSLASISLFSLPIFFALPVFGQEYGRVWKVLIKTVLIHGSRHAPSAVDLPNN